MSGVVQTTIRDLQDLQDAALSVSFAPQVFGPTSGGGEAPQFSSCIEFNCTIPDLEILAGSIALEICGPNRYSIGDEPAPLVLAEREIFHALKLPFGNIPGFASRDENLSLKLDDLPPVEGVPLGEVPVKKGDRSPFYWNTASRKRHMYVIGKSGVGKSYFCLLYTSPSPRDA